MTKTIVHLKLGSLRGTRTLVISSEEDAKCEGVPFSLMGATHKVGFENLWNSINGTNAFDANPWVWVVSFRRIA